MVCTAKYVDTLVYTSREDFVQAARSYCPFKYGKEAFKMID